MYLDFSYLVWLLGCAPFFIVGAGLDFEYKSINLF